MYKNCKRRSGDLKLDLSERKTKVLKMKNLCARSMKQNLVVFLADMYNVLEIHPAKCVRYPGEERAMQFLDGT